MSSGPKITASHLIILLSRGAPLTPGIDRIDKIDGIEWMDRGHDKRG